MQRPWLGGNAGMEPLYQAQGQAVSSWFGGQSAAQTAGDCLASPRRWMHRWIMRQYLHHRPSKHYAVVGQYGSLSDLFDPLAFKALIRGNALALSWLYSGDAIQPCFNPAELAFVLAVARIAMPASAAALTADTAGTVLNLTKGATFGETSFDTSFGPTGNRILDSVGIEDATLSNIRVSITRGTGADAFESSGGTEGFHVFVAQNYAKLQHPATCLHQARFHYTVRRWGRTSSEPFSLGSTAWRLWHR